MDSLRYWVIECHVDGFRFDLASALARELYDVDRLSAFFDTIHQDPVLSQVKLIAEPWDVGPGGYQVGNFPVLWSEWNGIYRDTMRDFWRGAGQRRASSPRASRAPATSTSPTRPPAVRVDQLHHRPRRLHAARPRRPTTRSTTTRNGEDNRDGTDDNRSWNCGVEGETDDPEINDAALAPAAQLPDDAAALAGRRRCCSAATSCRRSQDGNNNAWCQDTEISWYDWGLRERPGRPPGLHRRLIALRREHPVFRRSHFLAGAELGLGPARRVVVPPRRPPDDPARLAADYAHRSACSSTARRSRPHAAGEPIVDDSFLLLFNAHYEDMTFTLPARRFGGVWSHELCTREPKLAPDAERYASRDSLTVRRPLAAAAATRLMIATYRLQLGPEQDFAAVRELVPYLRDLGISHLYLSPSLQARSGSTHGYDVVDPTRVSDALGGEDGLRALADAGRGDRRDPRHRPQPHGHRRREPLVGRRGRARAGLRRRPRRPASTGASSTSTTSPPCARRTPRSSSSRTARRSSCVARGRHRRRARRPPGRARRPGGLPPRACATPAPSTSGSRRSCTPASRCAARLAGRRDGRLRVPQRRARGVRRPAAEAVLTGLLESTGDGGLRRARARGPARAGDDDVRARGRVAAARCAAVRRTLADALAALPVYRTYVEPWSGRVDDLDARCPRRASRASSRDACCSTRPERVRHALPADDAARDGQGHRGHRVLPLQPAARAQRGRRRPAPLRHLRRRVARANAGARGTTRTTC